MHGRRKDTIRRLSNGHHGPHPGRLIPFPSAELTLRQYLAGDAAARVELGLDLRGWPWSSRMSFWLDALGQLQEPGPDGEFPERLA